MDKEKLKNLLRPIVNQLVKEALLSEKGILSNVVKECVSGLSSGMIIERKNNFQPQQEEDVQDVLNNEQDIVHQKVESKRLQLAKEELQRQKAIIRSSGFSKMFEGLEPISGGSTNRPLSKEEQAQMGALANIKGEGVDITGIMAVARGGSAGWNKIIKK